VTPPALERVLETSLYCNTENEHQVRDFYERVMGLRKLGPRFAYRIGESLLLVFNSDETKDQKSPPAHGATGPAHACLLATDDSYEEWKSYLAEKDVTMVEEMTWPNGKRSFYFFDPAGNLLEIADGDLWQR
jgi:catechol 2,3-dioxygenase-like lactoylglutathione lyase family enzyme